MTNSPVHPCQQRVTTTGRSVSLSLLTSSLLLMLLLPMGGVFGGEGSRSGATVSQSSGGDEWRYRLNSRFLSGNYSGSPIHDQLNAGWLWLELESGPVNLKIGGARYGRDLTKGAEDVEERALYLSAGRRWRHTEGQFSSKIYLHHSQIDRSSGRVSGTLDIDQFEGRVEWRPASGRWWADLGYGHGRYEEGFTTTQWTPTLGLRFGPATLRLRHYAIRSGDQRVVGGAGHEDALNLRLRVALGGRVGPLKSIQLDYLFGERVHGLDSELFSLMPLAVRQGESWRVGGVFGITPRMYVAVMAGRQGLTIRSGDFELDFVGLGIGFGF